MLLADDVICVNCKKVFCCSKCREKHELNIHGGLTKSLDTQNNSFNLTCPICNGQTLTLHSDIKHDVLNHIMRNHLPLICKRCSKIYTKLDDLVEFSKCFNQNVACHRELESNESVQSSKIAVTISTQTSPCVKDLNFSDTNNNNNTPMSIINHRWKLKSKIGDGFVSDSASSIKNISSINNSSVMLKKSEPSKTTVKGEIARTTSTPLFGKPFGHQGFNATSGDHVSSIYNSVSEQSDITPPPVTNTDCILTCPNVDKTNRYHQKVRARGKMSLAVTPLRHVMSKSIQKAIVEHGMAANGRLTNRKKIFEYSDSCDSIPNAPLDLRLSPALRRTKSEVISTSKVEILGSSSETGAKRIFLSSKQTTESIMITSVETSTFPKNSSSNDSDGGNSVYKSCQSFEIITETKFNQIRMKSDEINGIEQIVDTVPHITPKIIGVPLSKKLINFDATPIVLTPRQTEDEVFFTPNSSPVKRSKISDSDGSSSQNAFSNKSTEKYSDCQESFEDELYSNSSGSSQSDEATTSNSRNLWSMVSAHFPSLKRRSSKNVNVETERSTGGSFIKRCASFAGSIVSQSKNKYDSDNNTEAAGYKRKRTNTDVQSLYLSTFTDSSDTNDSSTSSKRFRIQGRKPIDRMRIQNT